jgi:hypothetical protein
MTYKCLKCKKLSHSLTLKKRRCFYCHGQTERTRYTPVSNTEIAGALCKSA